MERVDLNALKKPALRKRIGVNRLRLARQGARLSACGATGAAKGRPDMIAPETFSHLENIKKRAGYLWRFL